MKQKLQNDKYIRYRKCLFVALYLSIFNLTAIWLFSIWQKIPANIHIKSGTKQEMNFEIPATGEIKRENSAYSSVMSTDSLSINMAEAVTFYGTSTSPMSFS